VGNLLADPPGGISRPHRDGSRSTVRVELGAPDRLPTLADGLLHARSDQRTPGADRADSAERDQVPGRRRVARSQVLTRDDLFRLSTVLDQSVLHRRFGDRAVMKSQMKQLLAWSERDNVSLRILPLDGRYPISTGAFVLVQSHKVHDVTYYDVVYLKHPDRRTLYRRGR
jgi:hypothetical protein